MKYGLSMSVANKELVDDAVTAGFDYLETSVKLLASYSEEDFIAAAENVKEIPIPVFCGCSLFPAEIMLVGPRRDMKQISEYLEMALTRITKLGAEVIVLGSGDSRRIPEGYTKEETLAELAEVCEKCIAPAARRFGLQVVVEPLCEKETDILNTVAESVDFYEALKIPEFKLLCDGYHMKTNGEDYAEIKKCGENLLLMHIANPDGRTIPASSDGEIYQGFFEALRAIGYDGHVTCEGRIPKTDENGTRLEKLKDCVAFLRRQ